MNGKRFIKEYSNYIIKRNREINCNKPMMLVDKKEAKITSVCGYYTKGLITISETMHWLAELDINLYIADDDVELNLSLNLCGGGHKYMKIWFSDNPPADDENVGCIGISIYNEDLKEIDSGELDYIDYSVELKDMINECANFMDLDVVVNWRKVNIEL